LKNTLGLFYTYFLLLYYIEILWPTYTIYTETVAYGK
jgi:hypothetical protein